MNARPSFKTITVAIVDDDEEIRSGLQWILDRTDGYSCVGTYRNCAEAADGMERSLPDVVLMDIGLPGRSGIECVETLKQRHPGVQFVMQTVYADDEKIFQSLRAGAVGYILKKNTPEAVLHAITEAHRGGVPFTGEVARKVLQYFSAPEPAAVDIDTLLSDREKEVLRELVQGHTYKSIAERLFISLPTVRFHLQNIYKKLHVRSRNEVVAKLGGGRELLRR